MLTSLRSLHNDVAKLHDKFDNHVAIQTEAVTQVRLDIKELKTKIALWAAVVVAVGTVASPLISEAITSLLH